MFSQEDEKVLKKHKNPILDKLFGKKSTRTEQTIDKSKQIFEDKLKQASDLKLEKPSLEPEKNTNVKQEPQKKNNEPQINSENNDATKAPGLSLTSINTTPAEEDLLLDLPDVPTKKPTKSNIENNSEELSPPKLS